MKKTVLFLLCALLYASAAPARGEDVLVIEMDGSALPASDAPSVSVWEQDAAGLNKLFKGKTRSYVLSAATSVPSVDDVLTDKNGQKFAFLRYGDEDSFRKLLFRFREPQTFVEAADSVPGVLALRRKYGLDLRVTRHAFENAFAQATFMTVSDLKNNSAKDVFQVTSGGKNPSVRYYVFEQDALIREFDDEKSYTQYLNALSAGNKQFTREQRQKRQEREAARQKALREEEQKRREEADEWRRALKEGGTTDQYLYGPRLIKSYQTQNNAPDKPANRPPKTKTGAN